MSARPDSACSTDPAANRILDQMVFVDSLGVVGRCVWEEGPWAIVDDGKGHLEPVRVADCDVVGVASMEEGVWHWG